MRERHDIKIIPVGLFEVGFQSGFEINFRRAGIFRLFTMAKVEEDASPARQDDLRGVAVPDGIENNLMLVSHDWPSQKKKSGAI